MRRLAVLTPKVLQLKAVVFMGFWLGVLSWAALKGLGILAGVAASQVAHSLLAFIAAGAGGLAVSYLLGRERRG